MRYRDLIEPKEDYTQCGNDLWQAKYDAGDTQSMRSQNLHGG
jgi:hypothetical protein